MEATLNDDAATRGRDAITRFRVEVYDILAEAAGLTSVKAQAEKHGIGRQHMFDLRAGRKLPSLPLALRMADDLTTTVETLFDWRAA